MPLPDTPTAAQLSQVISQVTAPAFLLGAVAAFVSVLISRMDRIIDRSQALDAIADDNKVKASLKSDIPRLKARAVLLNKRDIFFDDQRYCYVIASDRGLCERLFQRCA